MIFSSRIISLYQAQALKEVKRADWDDSSRLDNNSQGWDSFLCLPEFLNERERQKGVRWRLEEYCIKRRLSGKYNGPTRTTQANLIIT
jgi:hypothetical protein